MDKYKAIKQTEILNKCISVLDLIKQLTVRIRLNKELVERETIFVESLKIRAKKDLEIQQKTMDRLWKYYYKLVNTLDHGN